MQKLICRVNRRATYLALALIYLLSACSGDNNPAATHYHQVLAKPLILSESYSAVNYFPGRVEAPQRFDIGFDAQGKVTQVNVETGDRIEKGQILARLDTRLLDAERLSVLAERKESQARLKLIGIELKRQTELRRQGFAAEQKIDELLAEKDALSAQLERIAASLESADQRLEKSLIAAPFTGRIAARFVDPGEVVQVGAPIVRLLQGGSVELHVGVPTHLARHLKNGAMEAVVVEGEHVQAPIISINSAVSPATQTIIVRLLLPEIIVGRALFDGQIARLVINEERKVAGVWVPADSLVGSVRGTWNIFVLKKTGQSSLDGSPLYEIVRRKVTIAYMQGERAFVEGAFSANELLLSAGVHKIAPGQLVILSDKATVRKNLIKQNADQKNKLSQN